MTVVIDHEKYGDRAAFGGLVLAQTALRECGSDFEGVTLRESFGTVYNELDEVVGHIVD